MTVQQPSVSDLKTFLESAMHLRPKRRAVLVLLIQQIEIGVDGALTRFLDIITAIPDRNRPLRLPREFLRRHRI
jgi:hypothetical protein